MASEGATADSEEPSSKLDIDTTPDPDLELSYQEAVESSDFRYAEVYSRVETPTDKDAGQLRLDYNDPNVTHTLLIRPSDDEGDDEDHVVLQTDVVWRTIFPGDDPNVH